MKRYTCSWKGRNGEDISTKTMLEMRYLDCIATEGEVTESIAVIINEEYQVKAKVSVLEPNKRKQGLALIELDIGDANKLLEESFMRVGILIDAVIE